MSDSRPDRDLRDPIALGTRLLSQAETLRGDSRFKNVGLSKVADTATLSVRNYRNEESCTEKYGYPQDLPPTPF